MSCNVDERGRNMTFCSELASIITLHLTSKVLPDFVPWILSLRLHPGRPTVPSGEYYTQVWVYRNSSKEYFCYTSCVFSCKKND